MQTRTARSQSPPPRMPSPQPQTTPLPSPRPLPRKSSRQRLQLPRTPDSPPIPPTLIGSPLLNLTRPKQRAAPTFNVDLDDFGSRAASPGRTKHRRSASISVNHSPGRSRSPPPTPRRRPSNPPPVPPIPAALLTPSPPKPVLQPKNTNAALVPLACIPDLPAYPRKPALKVRKSVEAMTCMRFFALHNGEDAQCVQ
ncbi:hypothetical protein BV25DRAFT_1986333 [Artomyces pyxidatus]|uniref:Uncharacterized protein n=1 Tax=Artomyces pyxidatus TaxID=48021 RepID=A0ACB8TJX0_9AGAM|nr:hypothetical protein BV25DRAFT_1986333 [Artomyces pyxidatus]